VRPDIAMIFLIVLMLTGSAIAAEDSDPVWENYDETVDAKMVYCMEQQINGEGFANVYQNVTMGPLRLKSQGHGSGSYYYESLLDTSREFEYINTSSPFEVQTTGEQMIKMNETAEMTYAPAKFDFKGSFESGPISSLWKEDTSIRHCNIGVSMTAAFDQATSIRKDQSADLYWKGGTGDDYFTKFDSAKATAALNVDADFTGRASISAVVKEKAPLRAGLFNTTNDEIMETGDAKAKVLVDEDYVGSFHIVKNMDVELKQKRVKKDYDWLPCCYGGYDSLPKKYSGQQGIFDCTCLKTSRAGMYGLAVGTEPFKAWA